MCDDVHRLLYASALVNCCSTSSRVLGRRPLQHRRPQVGRRRGLNFPSIGGWSPSPGLTAMVAVKSVVGGRYLASTSKNQPSFTTWVRSHRDRLELRKSTRRWRSRKDEWGIREPNSWGGKTLSLLLLTYDIIGIHQLVHAHRSTCSYWPWFWISWMWSVNQYQDNTHFSIGSDHHQSQRTTTWLVWLRITSPMSRVRSSTGRNGSHEGSWRLRSQIPSSRRRLTTEKIEPDLLKK